MSTGSAGMTRRAAVLGAVMGLLALSGCVVVDRGGGGHYHYHHYHGRRRRRRGRRRHYHD